MKTKQQIEAAIELEKLKIAGLIEKLESTMNLNVASTASRDLNWSSGYLAALEFVLNEGDRNDQ